MKKYLISLLIPLVVLSGCSGQSPSEVQALNIAYSVPIPPPSFDYETGKRVIWDEKNIHVYNFLDHYDSSSGEPILFIYYGEPMSLIPLAKNNFSLVLPNGADTFTLSDLQANKNGLRWVRTH